MFQDPIYSLHLLRLRLPVSISQIFLVFYALHILRSTGLVFCKMSLNSELCFSHGYTGVTGFGMKPTEVKCLLNSSYQGYMPSTWVSTADGDPDQLAEAESSRFLPTPSFHTVLFRNKSLSRVHTSEVGFYALPLQCCIYTKCLEFLYGRLITSLPYIYLVSHLY